MSDDLTRFPQSNIEVSLASDAESTIDTLASRLADIERELILTRKGQEVGIYGEEVADMEDVDMDEVPEKEVENG